MSDYLNNDNDNYTRIRYCSICRRSEETTGRLLDLPGGLEVCPDCMQKVMNMASGLNYEELMKQWNAGWRPDMNDVNNWMNGDFSHPSYLDNEDTGMPAQDEEPGRIGDGEGASSGKSDAGSAGGASGRGSSAGDGAAAGEDAPQDSGSGTSLQPEPSANNAPAGGTAAGNGGGSGHGTRGGNAAGAADGSDGEDADKPSNPGDAKKKAGNQQKHANVSFVNLGDIFGGMQQKPQVKKKKKTGPKPVFTSENIPAPHLLKAELDKYVIGQERAKKTISVAAYNHYKRVKTGTMDEIEIEKSNILLIGPTGAGKTYLVKTLARLLDVPLAITDATSLTEAGYIGDDVESCISKLLAESDNDVDRAERGIVFIDEIDKLAKKQNMNSRDVSGEAVQQGLLKLLEGSQVEVPVGANSKNGMVPMVTVDTTNILFICGGAFPALEGFIKERLTKQSSFGFSGELKDRFNKDSDILSKVTNEDLRAFGMIPEFIGRLPIVCTLQSLDEDMLVRILKEPKNAIIKQYQKLLALDDVELEFEEDALHAIAQKAMKKDTGARALRSIIEEFMMDIMYEIPKDQNIGRVVITADYINGHGGPRVEIRQDLGTHIPAIEAKA